VLESCVELRVRNAIPAARAALSRVCAAAACPAAKASCWCGWCVHGALKWLVVLLLYQSLLAAAAHACCGWHPASFISLRVLCCLQCRSILSVPCVFPFHRFLPPCLVVWWVLPPCFAHTVSKVWADIFSASMAHPSPIEHCSTSRSSCRSTVLLHAAVAAALGSGHCPAALFTVTCCAPLADIQPVSSPPACDCLVFCGTKD
jgi:hypothetical protein